MFRSLPIALVLIFGLTVTASAGQDKSPHHAAMHAEHWLDHHVSAPHHAKAHKKPKHQDKSTHHAAMHAEHWLDHHVSAPHHRKPHKKAKHHTK